MHQISFKVCYKIPYIFSAFSLFFLFSFQIQIYLLKQKYKEPDKKNCGDFFFQINFYILMYTTVEKINCQHCANAVDLYYICHIKRCLIFLFLLTYVSVFFHNNPSLNCLRRKEESTSFQLTDLAFPKTFNHL